MTPPIMGQAKEFIPSKQLGPRLPQLQPGHELGQAPGTTGTTHLAQARAFIPTAPKPVLGQMGQMGQPAQPQPSQLVEHVNILGVPGQTFKPLGSQPPTDPGARASPVGGTGLNLRAEEFQKPTTSLGGPMGFEAPKQQDININSKAFQPSRTPQEVLLAQAARQVVQPAQVQELQEYKKKIDEKIARASEQGTKLRLDDILEDESITIENIDIQDQIRLACNNAGRANFKQKTEELKKLVEKRPPKIGDDGKEILDEKSQRADEHLMWLIHYILSKRLRSQGLNL